MKKLIFILTIFLLLGAIPTTALAQPPTPDDVLDTLVEALNDGDIETLMEIHTDDAVYHINPPPPGAPDTYTGQAEVRGWLEGLIANNTVMTMRNRTVEGDVITTDGWHTDEGLRAMGVNAIDGLAQYTVVDGKITQFNWVTTHESVAEIDVAVAALTAPDLVALVNARAEAFNAGDLETMMTFYATDAEYRIVPPPGSSPGTYLGFDEIQGRLEAVLADNPTLDVAIRKVEDNVVTAFTRHSDEGLQAMGVDFIEGVEEYTIVDGTIVDFVWTTTDESMTKIEAAIQAMTNPKPTPEQVVLNHITPMNDGDLAGAMAYMTKDAVIELVLFPGTPDIYVGAEEVEAWFSHLAEVHFENQIEVLYAVGNTVVTYEKTYNDFTREVGIAPLAGIGVYTVEDGLITSFTWTSTDQSRADLAAIISAEEEAQTGPTMIIEEETLYETYNGVDFIRYAGRFVSTTPDKAYDAPFEIVVPDDLSVSNGRLFFEPYHHVSQAGVRDFYFGSDFLFKRGFMHAAVCWQGSDDPDHICAPFEGDPETSEQIIIDFVNALKASDRSAVTGQVDYVYTGGYSSVAQILLSLLRTPKGDGLFDLSIPLTSGWPLPVQEFAPLPETMPETLIPAPEAGKVMMVNVEADVVMYNATVLRGDDSQPNYRVYEIAGGAHVPAPLYDTTGVMWLPILRALFVAGDQWVTEGMAPPTSTFIEVVPTDESDPVYDIPTGIQRDENLNALGGIHMPDLVLGRAQFVAADLEVWPKIGKAIDLTCEPLTDGSPRFESYDSYVKQFRDELEALVAARFILPDEVAGLIQAAAASGVGTTDYCAE